MERISALLKKLSKREKNLFFGLILVLSMVIGKFLVVDELIAAIHLRSDLLVIEEEVAKNENLFAELSKTKPESVRNSPLWVYREENSGLGGFLRKVSRSGEAKRDFNVRKIASEKTDHMSEYDKTVLELEVEGPFQTIGSFLEDIEGSRFLTRVESVQVFRMEKELRLCRARIRLNSFSWRDL